MPSFTDSLRGYAFNIHQRDSWTCVYCGLNGRESFASWLFLSLDHLLPKGHPQRDDPRFTVTSCFFCNCADNQYFTAAVVRGIVLDGRSPEELIALRKPFVMRTRTSYREFWDQNVHGK